MDMEEVLRRRRECLHSFIEINNPFGDRISICELCGYYSIRDRKARREPR